MRSTLLLSAILPVLIAAAPPTPPKIYNFQFSGNGCPNDSGSVKKSTDVLGDSATFTFGQLKGDDTQNCGIHVQSKGGSEGWQVAIKEVIYTGSVSLKPGSELDTYTQVFWSENAAATGTLGGELVCHDKAIKDDFTLKTSGALVWSKCTGADGYPGTLNANFRPVVQGNGGTYDVKSATWNFVWRKC